MQNLPKAEIYELFYHCTTWKYLVDAVVRKINERKPTQVLDLCCGTGLLSSLITPPEFGYTGVDLEPEYIQYAREHNRKLTHYFHCADAFWWDDRTVYPMVVCLGGIHHIPEKNQEQFVQQLVANLSRGGCLIVGDPLLSEFTTPLERRLCALELGTAYLKATQELGAPESITASVADIIGNDILQVEWKTSLSRTRAMLSPHFKHVRTFKTWPNTVVDGRFGDYYHVLNDPKNK